MSSQNFFYYYLFKQYLFFTVIPGASNLVPRALRVRSSQRKTRHSSGNAEGPGDEVEELVLIEGVYVSQIILDSVLKYSGLQ